MDKYKEELEILIKADCTIIEVISYEWQRVQGFIHKVADSLDRDWFIWSQISGLRRWNPALRDFENREGYKDPIDLLEYFIEVEEDIILILEDFHPFISEQNHRVIRYLREIVRLSRGKTLILSQPRKYIPDELSKEIGVVEVGLPDKDTLKFILEKVIDEYNLTESEITDDLLESALGLTVMEAELAFSKAAIKNGRLTEMEIPIIIEEKENIIKKDGLLEYYHSQDSLSDVGGLDSLKDWIKKRRHAYSKSAREFGLSMPRGVLLLGIPGCGKSLTAKAISKEWNFPLLRFDIGKVFGGLVGESERNIRKALEIAKTISPCILWIDEIEKGFSGVQGSGSSDSGTSSRIFGTFLTWMQEKTEPVFVIATANDISLLPPELLRKGRFDEIFFVDLPSNAERKNIFNIHLENIGRDGGDYNLDNLAELATGFSGAEIKEVVNEALFTAFDKGHELKTKDIQGAIESICPLSTTMSETINQLRKWADARARNASSSEQEHIQNVKSSKEVPRLKQERRNPFID